MDIGKMAKNVDIAMFKIMMIEMTCMPMYNRVFNHNDVNNCDLNPFCIKVTSAYKYEVFWAGIMPCKQLECSRADTRKSNQKLWSKIEVYIFVINYVFI